MPLAAEFLPRTISVATGESHTLTRASVKGLTPAEYEALSGKETALAQIIARSAEAKALGIQEKGLTMLLKSSVRDMKKELNRVKFEEQSIILPYIQRRQRSTINTNFWSVVSSARSDASTPGDKITGDAGFSARSLTVPCATGARDYYVDFTLKIGSEPSGWQTLLVDVARYFLPGMTIILLTWDASGVSPVAKTVQYEIRTARSVGDKAVVTARPIGSHANFSGVDQIYPTVAGSNNEFVPTYGMVQIAANNISDWESWCHNQPSEMNMGRIVNWFQTTRESREVNQVYKDMLEKILNGKTNPWDQSWNFQSIAEQNKRATMLSEEAWLRSVFYNDYLCPEQKPETYDQLPVVLDPENPNGQELEYKANALGIFTMLSESGRVLDLGGGVLDLDAIFEQLFLLKRYRQTDGDSVPVIDCMTDRKTANAIFSAMNQYYKHRYGWNVERFAKVDQKITHNGIVVFEYDLYDIPDASVQWGVFREPFFDDFVDAFKAAQVAGSAPASFVSRGRNLWFLDWSDISVGVAETNQVTRKNPDPAVTALYKCRMKANQTEYNLRSTKWTTFLDRPHRHLIIHNFLVDQTSAAAAPTTASLSATDSLQSP